jgi:hypothetical protein
VRLGILSGNFDFIGGADMLRIINTLFSHTAYAYLLLRNGILGFNRIGKTLRLGIKTLAAG